MITPKQKKILNFIENFQSKKGFAPSQKEIAKHFGYQSLGTVQNYLVRLQRHGFLRKNWNAKRGIQLLSQPQPLSDSSSLASRDQQAEALLVAIELPLVGRVAAGHPIEAIESKETLEVPASLLGLGEHFVLEVSGDSMIEDGILNGDYVVIRKQSTAQNGQTVVAVWNQEATIKKFFQKSGRVELHPANSAYKPMIISAQSGSDFQIKGILVSLIRNLRT